jgi:ferrochelatase
MRHHYESIGGRSPLTDITLAQADALQSRLGPTVPVAVGMRNWRPFIADALRDLEGAQITRAIGIPLAPQFSQLSVQKYIDTATTALPPEITLESVASFHNHPLLLDAFAEKILKAAPAPAEMVVFTAHSLPVRVIEAGDRYADEVASTALGVAQRAGIAQYELAYQSAGRTPEPWIGPDLSDLIRAKSALGVRRFLVVPIGFVCDHTEILFDIDVEAAAAAQGSGSHLRRTESLNTSPLFISALEDLVRRLL